MHLMKYIFTALLAFFVLISFTGCSDASATSPETPPIEISSTALWKDYKENEADADKKYGGQLLSVTGTVNSDITIFMGMQCITLKAEGAASFDDVICLFDSSYDASGLIYGEVATISGLCSGTKMQGSITIWESGIESKVMCVYLNDCKIP